MKISRQLTDTVAKAIRQGSTQRAACITVGISEVNYYRGVSGAKKSLRQEVCAKTRWTKHAFTSIKKQRKHMQTMPSSRSNPSKKQV